MNGKLCTQRACASLCVLALRTVQFMAEIVSKQSAKLSPGEQRNI